MMSKKKETILLATYGEYNKTIDEIAEKIMKIEDKEISDALFALLNLINHHTHPYKKPTVYR